MTIVRNGIIYEKRWTNDFFEPACQQCDHPCRNLGKGETNPCEAVIGEESALHRVYWKRVNQ